MAPFLIAAIVGASLFGSGTGLKVVSPKTDVTAQKVGTVLQVAGIGTVVGGALGSAIGTATATGVHVGFAGAHAVGAVGGLAVPVALGAGAGAAASVATVSLINRSAGSGLGF